jgi:hypothetical protein
MACGCGCSVAIVADSVVTVTAVETTLLAADPHRVNAFIQNHDSTNSVQVYFTSGQAFGSGPIILGPLQSINLGQAGIGVYKGIVYGITGGPDVAVGVFGER